jgi:hypothetical protein
MCRLLALGLFFVIFLAQVSFSIDLVNLYNQALLRHDYREALVILERLLATDSANTDFLREKVKICAALDLEKDFFSTLKKLQEIGNEKSTKAILEAIGHDLVSEVYSAKVKKMFEALGEEEVLKSWPEKNKKEKVIVVGKVFSGPSYSNSNQEKVSYNSRSRSESDWIDRGSAKQQGNDQDRVARLLALHNGGSSLVNDRKYYNADKSFNWQGMNKVKELITSAEKGAREYPEEFDFWEMLVRFIMLEHLLGKSVLKKELLNWAEKNMMALDPERTRMILEEFKSY